MKVALKKWVVGLALATSGIGIFAGFHNLLKPSIALAEAPSNVIQQLKADAMKALRDGQFIKSRDLLVKASSLSSDDPVLSKWVDWSNQFQSQQEGFISERRTQYEKAVEEVNKLVKANKEAYVIEFTRTAHLLSDNKTEFRSLPWVDAIINKAIANAKEFESKEQWLRCLRIYSALSSLEPSKPEWKEKLKLATRRIRLVALYTPDQLKTLQESESKDREDLEAVLRPSTQPATKPTTQASKAKDKDEADNFRIDWHDQLKGVKMLSLRDALTDARVDYYRDVPLPKVLAGGLFGLKAVVTTAGLEKAFPGLADDKKRQAFIDQIDEISRRVKGAMGLDEISEIRRTLLEVQRANSNTISLPEEVLASEFADGAFAELDPFTNVIWPSEMEEFTKTTSGEFSGIGVQIQVDEEGGLKVVSPLEDTPAYRAGIKAGDVITAINGKSAKGISINQAVKNITGPSGTLVTLTVRASDHTSKDYTITRQTIKVASVKGWSHRHGGGWEYIIDPVQKIAYTRITNFTKTTTEELKQALDEVKAQGGKALIVDLRYNPGGLLTAAIGVCETFVKDGVIVSTHADRPTRNPRTEAQANGQNVSDIPMVVLVNQYSASASEIVSGCLKDHKRALIVGERTFGKGSVQMLFPIGDRKQYLKLTTSHYYLPNGKCIHREEDSNDWGVNPDVTVEMTPEQMRTAIDARTDLDVLHARDEKAMEEPAKNIAPEDAARDPKAKKPTTKPKDPLSVDAQLQGALLLLRMALNGAQI